jgi:hypothetical protein
MLPIRRLSPTKPGSDASEIIRAPALFQPTMADIALGESRGT